MKSGTPELERKRLKFGRRGSVEHDDGRKFRIVRGDVLEALFEDSWDAWFLDEAGRVQFLQKVPELKSVPQADS